MKRSLLDRESNYGGPAARAVKTLRFLTLSEGSAPRRFIIAQNMYI